MTVKVFEYMIFISIDFNCLFFCFIVSFCSDGEGTKHLKVCQKYSGTGRILNSLLCVWKCGQTWSSLFNILLTMTE